MNELITLINKKKIIICIIVLLFQAISSLTMPFLIGEFIGVGVQRKGVSDNFPKIISEDAMNLFKKILPENIFEELISNYDFHKKYNGEICFSEKNFYNCYVISENADEKLVSEIYKNSVVSVLLFAQDNYENIEKINLEKLTSFVSFRFIYEKIDKITVTNEDVLKYYELSENTALMLKNQVADMLLPYVYEDAGLDLEETENKYILNISICMVACGFIQILSIIILNIISSDVSSEIEKTLRNKILIHTFKFGKTEYKKFPGNYITKVVTADIRQVGLIVEYLIKYFLFSPILALGGIIITLIINPRFSLLFFIASSFIIFGLFIIFKITEKRYEKLNEIYEKLSFVFKTGLTQLITIRSLGTEKIEIKKLEKFSIENKKEERFVLRAVFIALSLINLVTNIIVALMVVSVGSSLLESSLTISNIVTVLQYALITISAFMISGAACLFAPRAVISFKNIKELLNVDIADEINKKESNDNWSIKIENLKTDYLNSPVSFTINEGEVLGITGCSGSGKTTLADVLLCYEKSYSGSVYLGDNDLKELSRKFVRENISYIHSVPALYSKSVKENLLLSGAEENDNILLDALKYADCSFLPENPLNYIINNEGANFSGGQKNRLAIAGGIAKEAKIYILDDCFTSLDKVTREKILNNILQIKKGSTIILISQNTDDLKKCERVVVLSENGVEAAGSLDELEQTSDYYKQLILKQRGAKNYGS